MDYNKMKSYARNISVESEYEEYMSGDEGMQDLEDILYEAVKENRVIDGIFQCAHVLEHSPEVVSLCVLPSGVSKNISAHIQQKLIEAFCWENDISIVTMDDSVLNNLVKSNKSKAGAVDLQCVLLTSSKFDPADLDASENEVDGNFG